jgi:hypothetical protein
LTEQYPDEIALIRYHMPYPSGDPFYLFNTEENSARIDYYDITSTSHLYIDGIVDCGYAYHTWDSLFQVNMAVPSPMEIGIDGTYDSRGRQVILYISVTATDEITWDDLRLQCVTVENGIEWEAPNGLEIHNQVMRDMVPDPEGESFSISNGETVNFEKEFVLDNELDADSCEFMIFVQAHETKDILQAGKIKLYELDQTDIRDEHGKVPLASGIDCSYPNPFNATTTIKYRLSGQSDVNIGIYNILGRRVATIYDGVREAGRHSVIWSASVFPSGVYFAHLDKGEHGISIKMVLLK